MAELSVLDPYGMKFVFNACVRCPGCPADTHRFLHRAYVKICKLKMQFQYIDHSFGDRSNTPMDTSTSLLDEVRIQSMAIHVTGLHVNYIDLHFKVNYSKIIS